MSRSKKILNQIPTLLEMGFTVHFDTDDNICSIVTDGNLMIYLAHWSGGLRIAKKANFDKWGNSSFIEQDIPQTVKQWNILIAHAKTYMKCAKCNTMTHPSNSYTFRGNRVYCEWCGRQHKLKIKKVKAPLTIKSYMKSQKK